MARLGKIVPCLFNMGVLPLPLCRRHFIFPIYACDRRYCFAQRINHGTASLIQLLHLPVSTATGRRLLVKPIHSSHTHVNSLAVYYVTDPRPSATQRAKAQVKRAHATRYHALSPNCSL